MEIFVEHLSSLAWWRIVVGSLGLLFVLLFLISGFLEVKRRRELYIELASTLTGVSLMKIRREFQEQTETPFSKWMRVHIESIKRLLFQKRH